MYIQVAFIIIDKDEKVHVPFIEIHFGISFIFFIYFFYIFLFFLLLFFLIKMKLTLGLQQSQNLVLYASQNFVLQKYLLKSICPQTTGEQNL